MHPKVNPVDEMRKRHDIRTLKGKSDQKTIRAAAGTCPNMTNMAKKTTRNILHHQRETHNRC